MSTLWVVLIVWFASGVVLAGVFGWVKHQRRKVDAFYDELYARWRDDHVLAVEIDEEQDCGEPLRHSAIYTYGRRDLEGWGTPSFPSASSERELGAQGTPPYPPLTGE